MAYQEESKNKKAERHEAFKESDQMIERKTLPCCLFLAACAVQTFRLGLSLCFATLEVSTGQPLKPTAHPFSPQQRHKIEILSRYL
jgi:hypothetical protein